MTGVSPASLLAARALTATGRLERANDLLRLLRKRQIERGEAHELALTCVDLVWFACWRGDLGAAAQAADEAVERLLQLDAADARAHALAVRAHVDAYAGEEDAARHRAEEAAALLGTARAS